jgi:D-alanine-D-alanine ligase-like ATP-grasp enzyme
MKYLKTYESEEVSKSRQYIDQKNITEIEDILVDVNDECVVKVIIHSRNLRDGKTLYQIEASYHIDIRRSGNKLSIDTSIELQDKINIISTHLFNALKRLEVLGYDIVYRKMESWSLNDASGFDAKIQLWK